MTHRRKILGWLAAACLVCSAPAIALEASGVKFDETLQLAGKELKLNGAGIRYKAIFKVYAVGLYLPEKKTTLAEILPLPGPRRLAIVMLRDVSSEDFGDAFMQGLSNNADKAEQTSVLSQTMQFGELFAMFPGLKKGDTIALDWIPGSGTLCELNGKLVGHVIPDLAFYNVVLKIWLGKHPADSALRQKLLGDPET
ncbi:chalcone isomerase family protein [Janthinobacterium agaricidamnosum]|uniref:Putative lipoprotein transmembrane n=1 Tax=Janthinobacterium agaricidamnosum NBRC 102515 = DSM 9628 TaxID=1349767 RepID=W0VD94_9BURK|nr:chalcone isomerase family protein [Janthinobacterium agaricidamnosum]CDG85881.1 putative lipoprotein transmembrane [Janthinobacterium agaricidamnosum NBRC 102515 = DSM 9628]